MRRAGPPRELPPPLEMECLKSLWRVGEANVKQVRDDLAGERALAYTTVMTLLERLVKRGRVGRRKQGRAFYYFPLASRAEMRKLAVEELVMLHFDGSRGELQSYLGGVESPGAVPAEVVETRLDTTLL
ncbi:MAG TPA: BlaI/MecI/CopY family transcriptional regulator [Bryobacteraceae bacterium]|jgi:BlaI family transcriptional regulator, penicillinase repressor|nr:BlaI/MecI/CopY family transcriptional regulator [Bryobacteraceae bacterium]